MMKICIALLLFAFVNSAFALNPKLNCKSLEKVNGWNGSPTFDYDYVSAEVDDENNLLGVQITGAHTSDKRDLKAKLSSKYERAKYSLLEDAWCWYSVLLPKEVLNQKDDFKGAIQYSCEGSPYQYKYVDLNCKLENK